MSPDVHGVNNTCPTMFGPPMSRTSWHTTAASPPPALQPHTASCPGMPPSASRVVGDPPHRGHGVIDRRGESVLGRVAVVRPR